MEETTERKMDRKNIMFTTYNILTAMKAAGMAMKHEDLVARVMMQNGYHDRFESDGEYKNYILVVTGRLRDNGKISVKYVGDELRYGIVPINRPYKKKVEYGKK